MSIIKVNKDFSNTPGARYYSDGPDSGEQFFDTVLLPAYEKSIENKQKLTIDLDGVKGYASSFLSESFGLLSEKFGAQEVLKNIEIICLQEPDWKSAILNDYIPNAAKRKKKIQTKPA